MIGRKLFWMDIPRGLILLNWPTKPYGVTTDDNQMCDRAIKIRIGIELGHADE